MNIEEIDRTIKKLKVSQSFDMTDYFHRGDDDFTCGTPACIAGHVLSEEADKYIGSNCYSYNDGYDCMHAAAKKLDIESEVAINLFIPLGIGPYKNVTKEEAIYALEQLKKGFVNTYDLWPSKKPDIRSEA